MTDAPDWYDRTLELFDLLLDKHKYCPEHVLVFSSSHLPVWGRKTRPFPTPTITFYCNGCKERTLVDVSDLCINVPSLQQQDAFHQLGEWIASEVEKGNNPLVTLKGQATEKLFDEKPELRALAQYVVLKDKV